MRTFGNVTLLKMIERADAPQLRNLNFRRIGGVGGNGETE
jgi:hypothetical protein